MNVLVQGATILAVNVVDSGDAWVAPDQIIPKHIVPGAVVVDAGALPADYAPGKYSYNNGFMLIPVVPPPRVVPQSITMRQARLALFNANLLASVDTAINSLTDPAKTEVQIYWGYSPTVERQNPFVAQISQALGLTSAQLDQLFIAAAAL